jgi:hypothetical protein
MAAVRRLFKICLLCALLACGFGAAGDVLAHADAVDASHSAPCNDPPEQDGCDPFDGCCVPLAAIAPGPAAAPDSRPALPAAARLSFHVPDLPLPPPLGDRPH